MSCDSALQTALRPLGLPVFPNRYTGDSLEYIVTNWSLLPAIPAADHANAARYLVQVHYYLPDKQNPNPMLEQICLALAAADFTCPSIEPVDDYRRRSADVYGQHLTIECEYCDGGYDYGQNCDQRP